MKTYSDVTEDTLNSVMEFDHVITVHEDGTVTDGPGNLYAPEVFDERLSGDGWDFFSRGYTGQYCAGNSPIMHNSEYIGGRLARDILSTPGHYVVVVAEWPCDETICENPGDDCQEDHAEGWAVCIHSL